jgi:hypothetical protein
MSALSKAAGRMSAPKSINIKTSKTDKAKVAQAMKASRLRCLGLILKWSDTDPLHRNGTISDTSVSHKNPTYRLTCKTLWNEYSEWIKMQEFNWIVSINVIYRTEKRGDKTDNLEFIYTGSLSGKKSEQLEAIMKSELKNSIAANEYLEECHKNKGDFVICEFTAQIVGV